MTLDEIVVGQLYYVQISSNQYDLVYVIDKGWDDILQDGELHPFVAYEDTITRSVNIQSPSAFIPYDEVNVVKEYHRKPHCWHCKKDLDSETMKICKKCNGILCPDDGCCLCSFKY